jgi:serine/threonine protein kinase
MGEENCPEGLEVSIFGALRYPTDIPGVWSTQFCRLVGNTLEISKDSHFSALSKSFTIAPGTKITLTENEEITIQAGDESPLVLNAASGENISQWFVALTACAGSDKSLSMDDFRILSVLGRGFYGKVLLVEHLSSGELFAIKTIRKKKMREMGQMVVVESERKLLCSLRSHPFIVCLCFAFQNEHKFYLGLEYAAGGELLRHLASLPVVPIEESRFYIAEIILALEFLHENKIVYRDLKPENILLDRNGHIKLTDFGLSKEFEGEHRTFTFCGTCEYMAPEIVKREGYDYRVDIWALGIVFYEMLFQVTPFSGSSQSAIFDGILNSEPKFPSFAHPGAKRLIMKLLQKVPTNRPSIPEIKSDAFFVGTNWEEIKEKKVLPKSFRGFDVDYPSSYFPDYACESAKDSEVMSREGDITMVKGFSFSRE